MEDGLSGENVDARIESAHDEEQNASLRCLAGELVISFCHGRTCSDHLRQAGNFAVCYSPPIKTFYQRKKAKSNRIGAIKAVAHKLCLS